MSPPELRRKSPSRCSSSLRVLRRQGAAQHNQREAASRQAMLAFRSLDPFRALREPDRRRRDEERLSRSEQRTLSKTQNNHLTGKAPYKFEAGFLQQRVACEPPDDQQAALAAGIVDIRNHFALVWAATGVISVIAGIL